MTALNGLEPEQWLVLSALLGLCIGSLLNVVAHRLPVMMQRAWDADLAEAQGREPETLPRFNLFLPASHCPACKTKLKAWQNIPVLSYLLLRGKCGHCSSHISLRYPFVELLCGGLFVTVALLNPPGLVALALMGSALGWLAIQPFRRVCTTGQRCGWRGNWLFDTLDYLPTVQIGHWQRRYGIW